MVISHNILAMNSNRQLGIVRGECAKSVEKLSSGYRINKSADDAAGLSISEKMRRQIRGLTKGVENAEDGVSLCQVADGALAEVHDMLQRMNELAVKAANGTNSESDRRCINDEVSALLTEIDRVGDTTKFNEIFLFKGTEKKTIEKWVAGGTAGTGATRPQTIPAPTFDQVDMNCELDDGPFSARDNGGHLKLSATSTGATTPKTWPLIFGNGSTSSPKIQGEYILNGTSTIAFQIELQNLSASNYTAQQSGDDKEWSRTFSCTDGQSLDLSIVQKVTLHKKEAEEQYYTIDYTIKNNSGVNVKYNFVHHEDTAYDNNDRCESYFLNGGIGKVGQSSMYTTNPAYAALTNANVHYGSMPDSLSIVNEDAALCFTENLLLGAGGGTSADTLIIGQYYDIGALDEYTDATMGSVLGDTTNNMDLGFSLVWSDKTLTAGAENSLSFKQGIVKLEKDTNVPNTVVKAPTITTGNAPKPQMVTKDIMGGEHQLWIQSGCDTGDGMTLRVGAMNTGVLDIDEISVLTEGKADDAITRISTAIAKLSSQRSLLGAYQNRLEHTIKNEENIIENTTAAESQIRDTDMATEMVAYPNTNILMQAGQSMLTQANQSNQGVLSLLQ